MRKPTKLLAFGIYLLSAILFWGYPIGYDFIHKISMSCDPAFYLWSLKWWPYAITHRINPILVHTLWAPYGQNISWDTAVPSVALLFWPTTAVFGPIFSYNLATVISLALGGFGIYLICDNFGLKEYSSIFGGYIFFFSSYEWGQLTGHLNLDLVFVITFLIYLFALRFRNHINRKKYILISSVLLVFQFGISNEIYATFVVLSFIAWSISYIIFFNEQSITRQLRKIGGESCLSIIFSIIMLGPYLYYIFNGYISHSINNVSFYSADPINFIIPTPVALLFGRLFSSISSQYAGNFYEEGAYLGLPLIFIILYFTVKEWRKNRLYRCLIILFFLISIFTLGPYLRILSHKTQIVLPWYIFSKLPFIMHALPTRFTLYTSIIAAFIAAIWLDKSNVSKYPKMIIALAAILFLIPNVLTNYRGHDVEIPEFISKNIYKSYIKPRSNIIILPTYAMGGLENGRDPWQIGWRAPIWQYETNFYFNLAQGIAGPVPKELLSNLETASIVPVLYGAQLPPCYTAAFYSYILNCNVAKLLMPVNINNRTTKKLIKSLHINPMKIGGVLVYSVDKNYLRKHLTSCHNELKESIEDLKKSALIYHDRLHTFNNLCPVKLENMGLLDKSFGGFSQSAPNRNWTKNGYWIGAWGDSYAVGCSPVSVSTASFLNNLYADEASTIYFPYPKIFDPKSVNNYESGQILIVFKK